MGPRLGPHRVGRRACCWPTPTSRGSRSCASGRCSSPSPARADIYGVQLSGLPGIGIGFTDSFAWTHTVSAGNRFTAYTLDLVPGSPTSYKYDDGQKAMTSKPIAIDVKQPDGTTTTTTRTAWSSHYGPIIAFPGVGWTDTMTITYRDANIDNDAFFDQYLAMDQAKSLDEFIAAHQDHQGVPLFNTIATSKDGRAWYADTSATPDLSPGGHRRLRGVAQDQHHRLGGGRQRRGGARRLDVAQRVGERARRPQPRARPLRQDAAGRAVRLRVQRQRQLLDPQRRPPAGRRLLAAARAPRTPPARCAPGRTPPCSATRRRPGRPGPTASSASTSWPPPPCRTGATRPGC